MTTTAECTTVDLDILAAVHESGHAIVGFALGLPIRSITIEPSGWSLGRTYLDLIPNPPDAWTVERVATMLLGGDEATLRHSGIIQRASEDCDLAVFHRLVQGFSPDRIMKMHEFVEVLVDNTHIWSRLMTLAEALVERRTVSGPAARAIIFEYAQLSISYDNAYI
jgi:hypothetical protein